MSPDRDGLGDRMKTYEQVTRALLPRRTFTVLRVDGRSFHTYLRGAARPYDIGFMADMDAVAEGLCAEIAGSVFAYVQSDEVSVLAVDFAGEGTQPWFGGEVQKWCSVGASIATAVLNARRPGSMAMFDARVFTIADPVEVARYFIWRQRDAVRNSVAMAAQAEFPHRRLQGVGSAGMQELLWSERGINWNDYPDGCKRGRVVVRERAERPVTFTHTRTGVAETVVALRSWWQTRPAPHFTTDAGGFLAATVPVRPALGAAA
ncbi:tRNA(His) guanylyltransferase Thg1 family protein [Dactylosporangium sp. NPDC005572]|uniref:tRNA(His) guanylyltransferase Thg1 family protein n=1 Tax=Dactylosporangium sp. NPDC005572 TaxID=3156889 RepID=UPI0033B9B42A